MPSARRPLLALVTLLTLLVFSGACVARMVRMPGESFTGAVPPLDADGQALASRLAAHVQVLSERIGERNVPAFPERLDAAAQYVETELTRLGYLVTRQRYTVDDVPVANLVAERTGAPRASEVIVVGAHYDSAQGTPGADDNASGVAVALELARVFAHRVPTRTVRFVFFTNEEPPWFETPRMGSQMYAQAARANGDDVRAMLALETMGYFTDDEASQHYPWPFSRFYPSTGHFLAFVGDTASTEMVRTCVETFRARATLAAEGAALPRFVEGADWSDHGPFWRAGYRAVMVTDTAPFRNPHYHRATDVPAVVDAERLARAVQGLTAVLEVLSGRDGVP